ncbi:MAG TPA: hypothetical protein VN840_13310 [Streptosporangiaceae bacterium]|nr:hypothetical protein [Streptosporangiaceae bacterium]
MSDADLVREAAEELYSSALEEFVQRRAALAARARAAGDAAAAKKIAGLRKPTRSAWVLNQLARSAPAGASQLAELGAEFRAAQQSLDGAAIRELSVRRRKLIDSLARQAFTMAGEQAPSAALADEVTATLGAALADPQIAGQLQAGTLERAVRSDGLGPPEAPSMTPVTPPSGKGRSPASTDQPAPAKPGAPTGAPAARAAAERAGAKRAIAERAGAGRARGPHQAEADRASTAQASTAQAGADRASPVQASTAQAEAERASAERASAERERQRRVVAETERRVAEADQEAEAAASAEREQESAVRLIEEQLADARDALADARLRVRRANASQRYARQALERLLAQHAAARPPSLP